MREKRKFVRLQAAIGVSYRRIRPAGASKRTRMVDSLVRNISGGGLSLMVMEAMRPGDLLDIEIQIPHLKDPLKAVGEVVWCRPEAGREGQMEAAVHFRDIDPPALNRLLEFVYMIGIG